MVSSETIPPRRKDTKKHQESLSRGLGEHEAKRSAFDGSVALGLADLLVEMITFQVNAGAPDRLGSLTRRLLDLLEGGDDFVLRAARGVILTARAWDRAARRAQSAALLRRTGRLEQLLEEGESTSPEFVSALRDLRQLRQEHAIVS